MTRFMQKIQRGRYPNNDYRMVRAEERDDGWYVDTREIDDKGWRRYAISGAKERDVRQLLNKEYDSRY